jgi:hypothetical protein
MWHRRTVLLALITAAGGMACQHAPVSYAPAARSGGYSLAPLPSSALMPPDFVGRAPPRSDQDADFFFVREDGAFVYLRGLRLPESDDDASAESVLRGSLPIVTILGLRLANERPDRQTNPKIFEGPREVEGIAEDSAEVVLGVPHPALELYAAVVRRERLCVFVVAGKGGGAPAPIDEGRAVLRRIRFDPAPR